MGDNTTAVPRYAPGPEDASYRPPPLAPHGSSNDIGNPTAPPLPPTSAYHSPNQNQFSSQGPFANAPPPTPPPGVPPPPPYGAPPPPPPSHPHPHAPGQPPYATGFQSPHGPPPHGYDHAGAGDPNMPMVTQQNSSVSSSIGGDSDQGKPWTSLAFGFVAGIILNIFGFCTICCLPASKPGSKRRRKYYVAGIVAGVSVQCICIAIIVAPIIAAIRKLTKKKRGYSRSIRFAHVAFQVQQHDMPALALAHHPNIPQQHLL